MTVLTMIWNDRHCDGSGSFNWYEVTLPSTPDELRKMDRQVLVELIIRRYYVMTADVNDTLDDTFATICEAIKDCGIVAIFIGTMPEEL